MSPADDPWPVAVSALKLATRVIEEIQAGVVADGFRDVTPLHGFAFERIGACDTTVAELSAHLGVSKQAAAQLTERLVRDGYVTRSVHPRDRRAHLLALTPRGVDCTRSARRAAERAVRHWRAELAPAEAAAFEAALLRLTASIGVLRPAL